MPRISAARPTPCSPPAAIVRALRVTMMIYLLRDRSQPLLACRRASFYTYTLVKATGCAASWFRPHKLHADRRLQSPAIRYLRFTSSVFGPAPVGRQRQPGRRRTDVEACMVIWCQVLWRDTLWCELMWYDDQNWHWWLWWMDSTRRSFLCRV